ncbi:MAG: hypothetical protein ACR2K3_01240 [Nocardioides sp.]
MPSNLMIVNFLIFCSVLCLALSAQLHAPLFFAYSIALVGGSAVLRHQQLEVAKPARRDDDRG